MNNNCNNDDHSDDEIFIGKLSLREFKKHISWNTMPSRNHKSITKHKLSKSLDRDKTVTDSCNYNDSLKIIESHSEPNLMRDSFASIMSDAAPDWYTRDNDDSFIAMENMVAKLCVSPGPNGSNEKLNNTLEVIEYILKNGPKEGVGNEIKEELNKINTELLDKYEETGPSEENNHLILPEPIDTYNSAQPELMVHPISIQPQSNIQSNVISVKKTPIQKNKLANLIQENNPKTPIFKTPARPSIKKTPATSIRKTPSKTKIYQHISSPVASYIKNTPKVSLVKDIRPKTTLPSTSHIPVIVKNQPKIKSDNKENVNLPMLAYKHAKITKMIKVAEERKLPQCQWVEQITSLSKPIVVRHEHRELNVKNNEVKYQQEESYVGLPCHQAEVSVCTQKSAFKH